MQFSAAIQPQLRSAMPFVPLTKALLVVMVPVIIILIVVAAYFGYRRNWFRTALASSAALALLAGPPVVANVVNGILAAITTQVNANTTARISPMAFDGLTILTAAIILGVAWMAKTATADWQKKAYRVGAIVLLLWFAAEKTSPALAYMKSLF